MPRSPFPAVTVVLATCNAARNLEIVLPALAAVRPALHEVIVVDDDSRDGSLDTARRVLPWVRTIPRAGAGRGSKLARGIAAATGDVIVLFGADGSTDPAEIPALVTALVDGADLATGSRFTPGGGSDAVGLLCRTRNAGLNGVANALFGTSYTDLGYGFTAFWADLLPQLELSGADTEIETVLSCRVAVAGLKIVEVPSIERRPVFGEPDTRTLAERARVMRTLLAERRRADRARTI